MDEAENIGLASIVGADKQVDFAQRREPLQLTAEASITCQREPIEKHVSPFLRSPEWFEPRYPRWPLNARRARMPGFSGHALPRSAEKVERKRQKKRRVKGVMGQIALTSWRYCFLGPSPGRLQTPILFRSAMRPGNVPNCNRNSIDTRYERPARLLTGAARGRRRKLCAPGFRTVVEIREFRATSNERETHRGRSPRHETRQLRCRRSRLNALCTSQSWSIRHFLARQRNQLGNPTERRVCLRSIPGTQTHF